MTHDIFICHSSKDRTIANAICSKLEQNRIRCWIAPRDVLPGSDYAQSIIEAISGTKLTVLVFSDNSNRSPHVHREIERTVSHGIPILPFRVDDVIPSPSLEYFISDAHWLDAITPPMEQHLHHLAGTVRLLLERAEKAASSEVAPPPVVSPQEATLARPEPTRPSASGATLPSWWRWAALGVVAVVGAVIAGALVLGGRNSGSTPAPVTTSSARAAPAAPAASATSAAPVKTTAKIGEAIALNGMDAGSKAAVTAMKVVDPTTSTDLVSTPAPGSRYVAVEFQIQNTGTVLYDDTPDNCAIVLDASGHQTEATTVLSVAAGPVFPTTVKLQPNQKTSGYVVFELAKTSTVSKVQFTMDSGYADFGGAWTLR